MTDRQGADVILINRASLARWRQAEATVDALVEQVRPLDQALWLKLEAAINTLVIEVQQAWLAAAFRALGEQWG